MITDYKFWICAVVALVASLYVFEVKFFLDGIRWRALTKLDFEIIFGYLALLTINTGFFLFLWCVFNLVGFFIFMLVLLKTHFDIRGGSDDRPYS